MILNFVTFHNLTIGVEPCEFVAAIAATYVSFWLDLFFSQEHELASQPFKNQRAEVSKCQLSQSGNHAYE